MPERARRSAMRRSPLMRSMRFISEELPKGAGLLDVSPQARQALAQLRIVDGEGDADISVATRSECDAGHDRGILGEQKCLDRKSTRLNSSHQIISYAVFCLKKKTQNQCSLPCSLCSP